MNDTSYTDTTMRKTKYLDSQSIRKQAMLHSIHRSIKKQDVTMIVGKTQHTEVLALEDNNLLEMKEIQGNMLTLRKQSDTYKTQSLAKEKEIAQLKEELEKLKIKEENIKKSGSHVQHKMEEAQKIFVESKDKFEDIVQVKKSYQQMLKRMQKDYLINQSQLHDLENAISKKSTVQNQTNLHQFQTAQFNENTQKMMDELLKNVEKQHQEREQELKKFQQNIKERQENEQKRDERHKEQLQISEKALYEKDQSEKKWLKLYYVHRFVQNILKSKIEKELKKFSVVEKAFQKVKTTTGIGEAQEIVSKFLSREETYGELLSTISECEKKIELLKKTNEEFKVKLAAMKSEVEEISQGKFEKKGNMELIFKELTGAEEKFKKIEVIREKSYQWAIKLMKKLSQIQNKKSVNFYTVFPREKFAELFEGLNNNLIDIVSEIQTEDIEEVLFEIQREQDYADENYLRKNIRVKGKKDKVEKEDEEGEGEQKEAEISSEQESNESQKEDGENEQEHFCQIREEIKKKK